MFQCVRVCRWVTLEMMVWGLVMERVLAAFPVLSKYFLSCCLTWPQMDQTRKMSLSLFFFLLEVVSCSCNGYSGSMTRSKIAAERVMTWVIHMYCMYCVHFFLYYSIFNHVCETLVLDVCLCTVIPHLLSHGPAQMCWDGCSLILATVFDHRGRNSARIAFNSTSGHSARPGMCRSRLTMLPCRTVRVETGAA